MATLRQGEREAHTVFAVFPGLHTCSGRTKCRATLFSVVSLVFWWMRSFFGWTTIFRWWITISCSHFNKKSLKNEVKSPIFACLLTRCTICLFKVHSSENHQKNISRLPFFKAGENHFSILRVDWLTFNFV